MKLTCTVCGTVKGASKERAMKLVEAAGSEEALRAKYVCRVCRPKKVAAGASADAAPAAV